MVRRATAPTGAQRASLVGQPAPSNGAPHVQVADMQRSRLIAAMVDVIDELGYTQATVGRVTTRARVSRRTFYELFANRDECLVAVVEDVISILAGELSTAGLEDLEWRERVHVGLWTILGFFDREPALARVCVVETLRAGPEVLRRREAILARLVAAVDEGRGESGRAADCGPLMAEGVVGAAFSITHARLLRREELGDLVKELMGIIVLPYLGPAASRREQARALPAPQRERAQAMRDVRDPLKGVRMRLTYRTVRVLEGIAEHPGASNRMVADYAGINDPGQISKLLWRLERLGLLTNTEEGHAKGEPNAWKLTGQGQRVASSIRLHSHPRERKAA